MCWDCVRIELELFITDSHYFHVLKKQKHAHFYSEVRIALINMQHSARLYKLSLLRNIAAVVLKDQSRPALQ